MNTEQRLEQVIARYKSQGYEVVLRPSADALPAFAKDFHVEILATRPDSKVLVSAKKNSMEFEAAATIPHQVEITNEQPGWRYDVFILGIDRPMTTTRRNVSEMSEEEIRQALEVVQRMSAAGFVGPSLSTAWALFEAAMRRNLGARGTAEDWDSMPRTMLTELYSAGAFPESTFRRLEELLQLRDEVVHGFALPRVESSDVQFLIQTTQRLLSTVPLAKQTA